MTASTKARDTLWVLLSEQTPVEIDTALYARYREALEIRHKREAALTSLRHQVGDKFDYYNKFWSKTKDEVLQAARLLAETDQRPYVGRNAVDTLARYDALSAELVANIESCEGFNAEFNRRGGWTRAFLVTDGHVHSSQCCSTCYPTTEFTWLVDLSDHDEAEIVALAADRACTVCYPSAPTLRDFQKASPLFTEEEAERNAARDQRAAEKAARQAKKIANGLTHDGSEFRVDYVEPSAPGWERNAEGKSVHVVRDRPRHETFKTERAAVQWVVQEICWNTGGRNEYERPAWEAVVQAVATKHDKHTDEVWTEIQTKVEAKNKRDGRF